MKNRMNSITVLIFTITVFLTILQPGLSTAKDQPVILEILFMNHGPMQPTIRELQALIANYQDGVEARWFDVDQNEGKAFMKAKNLTGHIPLVVFVNGSTVYRIDGREVTFLGFPSGAGPYQFQGKWSIKDLETVIQSLLESRS